MYLYRLLRPELVRSNPEALSSDAFSPFGQQDTQHNQRVIEAYDRLLNIVIPNFADRWVRSAHRIQQFNLIQELHNSGINCRYLGRVYDACLGVPAPLNSGTDPVPCLLGTRIPPSLIHSSLAHSLE